MHCERNLFILVRCLAFFADEIDKVSGMADTDHPNSKLFQRLVLNALVFSFTLLSSIALAQDIYEDNNTLETATLLVVGDPTPQSHTLDPDQDVDWFRFNAQFFDVYDIKTFCGVEIVLF